MHSARRRRRRLLPLATLAVLALSQSACTAKAVSSSGSSDSGGSLAGMAPMLSVERFLQATNANDYDAMARLFGTAEGPILENRGGAKPEEVELRMAALADILRHDDYRIVSEAREPGRSHPANRIGVNITQGSRVVRDVGFVVVQTEEGRWLVENIDVKKVTGT